MYFLHENFSTAQIKACDAYTIYAEGISSLDLVERAAMACVIHIRRFYSIDTPFVLLCGMGNNGADGLALARLLAQQGFGIKVFLLQHRNESSPENKANLNKLLRINASLVEYVEPNTFVTDLPEQVVLIDAILGTGLSYQVENWLIRFFCSYQSSAQSKNSNRYTEWLARRYYSPYRGKRTFCKRNTQFSIV